MNTQTTTDHQMMAVVDIKTAPFNPSSRTEKKALAALMAAIEKVGRIIVPLIVTEDGHLADGHRRLACAVALGLTHVPVIVVPGLTLDILWSYLNGGNLPVKTKTWGIAVANGLSLETVPDKEQRTISELIMIAGRRQFERLMENNSPYILRPAKALAQYTGDESNKWIKTILSWMADQGQQRPAIDAMRDECPPEVLISAIKENRPIRRYWGIA